MAKLSQSMAGVLLGLGAFALFAGHDALIKAIAPRYSALQITFGIALCSFPLLFALVYLSPQPLRLRPHRPGLVALRSTLSAASALCAYSALAQLPLAQVYALLFSTPLLITALAAPLLGERIGPRRWAAVIIGLLGVLVVLRPGTMVLEWGHALALAAAILSAFSTILLRKLSRIEHSMTMIGGVMAANLILLGMAMPWAYIPMSGADSAILVLVSLMCCGGMGLVILAYRRAEAALVAPMQYSQLLWAVAFGMLFFDETPDLWTLVGAGIVISSGVYIVLREARLARQDK